VTVDWSKLPDVIAVGLLAWAFASVAHRSYAPVSGHWMTGWVLIVLHFVGLTFASIQGVWGTAALTLAILALVWAGLLFTRASVPYKSEFSSQLMLGTLLATYTLYVGALMVSAPAWVLRGAALLLGLGPLTLALIFLRRFSHVLRWFVVGLHVALGAILLAVQNKPNGSDTALNAVLLVVYLSCSIHFLHMYRRGTAGAFISITGFFFWASVFVVAPLQMAFFPAVQIESEVWNLPKYVVAVGMILLLLEDQVEHNKHLALHDDLTGLPNRRLFQDRLSSAVERARRAQTQTALLMMDLDHFKQVNDTLGHHAGDLLLQNVAKLFNSRMRRSDTVARTGGDEFAVILEAPISREEATRVGEKLLKLLHEPMTLKGRPIRVAGSLGVAVFPEDASNMESLCIAADLRMYEDKRSNSRDRASINPLCVDCDKLERPERTTELDVTR
jgi:diguanylate cyclase (GGDEF)-like protein